MADKEKEVSPPIFESMLKLLWFIFVSVSILNFFLTTHDLNKSVKELSQRVWTLEHKEK